jgi:hypothetical protein
MSAFIVHNLGLVVPSIEIPAIYQNTYCDRLHGAFERPSRLSSVEGEGRKRREAAATATDFEHAPVGFQSAKFDHGVHSLLAAVPEQLGVRKGVDPDTQVLGREREHHGNHQMDEFQLRSGRMILIIEV